jgi:vacuolar protein sorting-associated protein 13A/C
MPTISPFGKNPPGFCMHRDDLTVTRRKSPKISLRLHAPIELENLLPYDIQYRIYDKNTDQQWKSYLRHGGIMPVHSVELAHLVLMNITIQETGE